MNQFPELSTTSRESAVELENTFLRHVFLWMIAGLGVTTAVAVWFQSSTNISEWIISHQPIFWGAIIAEFVLVIALIAAIKWIPAPLAGFMFFLYAGLTGFTFSLILDAYTTSSIVGAFAGATGVFAGMALYGYATQRDLSKFGGILFGALIGLIVASIVHVFVGGSTFNLIIGWAGVLIFAGLTAWDIQQIKNQAAQGFGGEEAARKSAIVGALSLYLNFINLFLSLLRIFGGRD
jgi:FtsH-binding integral membrane protein